MNPQGGRATVIWMFSDGKPGHENQSNGVLAALERRLDAAGRRCRVIRRPPIATGRALRVLIGLGKPSAAVVAPDDPLPHLALGAGHATHLSLLAAQRLGAKTVVLMSPSLPLAWFDLAAIPAHDEPRAARNVLVTRGAPNRARPGVKDPARGLILIGGPSRHHGWGDAALVEAVRAVASRTPGMHFTLTTSRRTPPGTLACLREIARATECLVVVPYENTDRDWLPRTLACATTAWVTEDSVSMLYEALSAGCAVGLLPLPQRSGGGSADRVARGVETLLRDHLAVSYADWRAGALLRAATEPLDEAGRIADAILERGWL